MRSSALSSRLSLRWIPGQGRVRTKPLARRTLARYAVWQGNCDVAAQTNRSNVAAFRITNSIEYPLSNCPAKPRAASFKRLYRK